MPNKPDEISPIPPLSEIGPYGDSGEKLIPAAITNGVSKIRERFHFRPHKESGQPHGFAATGKERILLALAREIGAVFKKI